MNVFDVPGGQDPKVQEIIDWLSDNGIIIIKKEDHQQLLSTQKKLEHSLSAVTGRYEKAMEQYESLKRVRYNSNIMEHCGVIDTLVKVLDTKPISYLDDFGEKIKDVSIFNQQDLEMIRLTIMQHVEFLSPNEPITASSPVKPKNE